MSEQISGYTQFNACYVLLARGLGELPPRKGAYLGPEPEDSRAHI